MHDRRFLRRAALAFAAIVVGLVAATAWAANIAGTAGNDTLRGTAKADRISGGAGNDKLFGLGGNDVLNGGPGDDLLVGGPGADVLNCGPGRDKAMADKSDKLTGCEVVTGRPNPVPPPPPPPTTTTTTTTTTTPTPPPATALPGRYCGFTNNGSGICFDITAGGQGFTNAKFAITTPCSPDSRFIITITTSGVIPVKPDLTFDLEATAGELAGSNIKGQLDTAGNAKGTVHVSDSFDYQGTHYTCQFDTEWTAKLQQ